MSDGEHEINYKQRCTEICTCNRKCIFHVNRQKLNGNQMSSGGGRGKGGDRMSQLPRATQSLIWRMQKLKLRDFNIATHWNAFAAVWNYSRRITLSSDLSVWRLHGNITLLAASRSLYITWIIFITFIVAKRRLNWMTRPRFHCVRIVRYNISNILI